MIKRLTRTAPRTWLGNGMGYDPAEYAAITTRGEILVRVQFYAGQWCADVLSDLSQNKRFDAFQDARIYALQKANEAIA